MVAIGSAGVLAPGKWRWVRALAWMLGLCALIVIGFKCRRQRHGFGCSLRAKDAAPGDRLLAAIAGSLAVLIIYRLAVAIGSGGPFGSWTCAPRAPQQLLLGMVAGAASRGDHRRAVGLRLGRHRELPGRRRGAGAFATPFARSPGGGLCFGSSSSGCLWRAFSIWPAIVLAAVVLPARCISPIRTSASLPRCA